MGLATPCHVKPPVETITLILLPLQRFSSGTSFFDFLSKHGCFENWLGLRVGNHAHVEIQRIVPNKDFYEILQEAQKHDQHAFSELHHSSMESLFFSNSFSHFVLPFLLQKILTLWFLLLIPLGWVPGWSSRSSLTLELHSQKSNTFDVNSWFYKHCKLHILFKNLYIFL